MNPFKKLASQTAIYGLPTIIGRLLNYFLVPLYTYNFSTSEYGTVNEMYAYVSFLLIVLTYGMETALFNFSRLQDDKQKVYSTILTCVTLTSAVFIAGLTIFFQPIANLIEYPTHPEYITWFALILGLDAVSSIAFAKLREQNKAKNFALIKTLNIAVNIFFNVFFLWICKSEFDAGKNSSLACFYNPEIGIGYIFISNLIASVVTFLVLLPSILKAVSPLQRGAGGILDFSMLKTILPYALPLLIAGLAGMTNETIDRILLKYLLPSNIALEQVGIYGACYKISIIMTMFVQTFRFAAEPFFFSHAKETDSKQVYARVMDYFVIICMIIFLGTMMNISWIQYFVGRDFRDGLAVVPILLMANFFLGVFFNLSIWYKLTGQTKWGAYLTIFGAVITLIGNFVFIPIYGYMASAWATLVCYAGMMTLSYFIGNKYYPVKYDMKRTLGYLALALLLFALSHYLEIKSDILDIAAKNSLLVLFVIIVFIFERKNLFRKKNESQNN
ncbi:MAG: polysaccharide biosynthesis C-terminal domain-containing protein [Bacteroidetes bacterium]|nr:polysaccharide biosynthesis C-terminal domain-containing protein [Bacteroidota bacterium]